MSRIPFCLSLVATALLAGCQTTEPVTPVPVVTAPNAGVVVNAPPVAGVPSQPVVVAPATTTVAPAVVAATPIGAVRPGVGRVESNTRLTEATGMPNPMRRIGARMDDGTVQFFDTRAQNLEV